MPGKLCGGEMSENKMYVFIKRDLFERPEHLGYTGIKELAGAWPLSLVKSETSPVKDRYDPKYHGSYALPVGMAPEFTEACFHDLAIDHLNKKVATKEEEIAKLREALKPFADIGIGTNPDYEPMIRMDREAVVRARAVLAKVGEA